MENKECLFYIDHNPPECSGTWDGAIHKGACKVNSTDCADTPQCFIKNLYSKLKAKNKECENQKERLEYFTEKTTQLLNDIDNLDRFNTELQEESEELKNATVTLAEGLNFQQERADKLEQECDRLKEKQKELLHDCNSCNFHKYKQALDEIEHILETYSDDDWKATREIENIINKAKEQ